MSEQGTFRISIRGEPVPKGSMRAFVVKGRPIITSDNPKVRPWESLLRSRVSQEWEGPPWQGAVEMTLVFHLLRPKAAKKRLWPHVRPDLDKLVRPVQDALKGAGALGDDAQIVALCAEKRYGEEPGLDLELRRLA